MKTINEWMGKRQWGQVAQLSRDSGINLRTLARWIRNNSHYIDDQGYVYKKVGKIDVQNNR